MGEPATSRAGGGPVHQRADDVFAAALHDQTLLLHATTGRYHGLNPVGARIWELLAEPMAEAALVQRLVAEFEVTEEECEREVSAFLSLLRDRGLLAAG
ncbi:HPr-rel-A system PqqD family peptide chaperone [Roseomonas stagni]|uniref:HPr-rel-A system PqqD family peptide chaperone n=1 Tax=Falsiroseomonas algicola TaxID=2716930 RepID=A0A6M1LUN2_9PROT|nr:HPr-rel-A system PqqD family peptide chaperone [Falsiroseomonas algicola]NGM24195.1 HPr-rel-A system PqqD family peptide chaperone [Falsiroseomonas algicola]